MLKNVIKVNKVIIIKLVFKTHLKTNIIQFYKKEDLFLSDSDIKALLVSVVNLIKNNAVKKAENVFKQQVFYYQNLLKLNMAKLEQANQEIKKLKGK